MSCLRLELSQIGPVNGRSQLPHQIILWCIKLKRQMPVGNFHAQANFSDFLISDTQVGSQKGQRSGRIFYASGSLKPETESASHGQAGGQLERLEGELFAVSLQGQTSVGQIIRSRSGQAFSVWPEELQSSEQNLFICGFHLSCELTEGFAKSHQICPLKVGLNHGPAGCATQLRHDSQAPICLRVWATKACEQISN